MSRPYARAGAVALAIACAAGAGPAMAQAKKLGAYAGTIEVNQSLPTLTYRAKVKLSLPVSERSSSSIDAELLSGEAPDATVLVTQWDTFRRETSADSGGQFNTTRCSLAAPAEIPMSATGVLNVDLKKKTHAMSVALVSKKDLAFNCTHSRSGAFKKKMGIAFAIGTGAPGMQHQVQLPFSDPGRLTATHTLVPPAYASKDEHGPLVQVWDLRSVQ
jgi:hypothetical protein